MTTAQKAAPTEFNPDLDLKIDRIVDVPPSLVWRVWTEPKHLMPWFCPKPWQTVECDIDLRPGGIFRTVMKSPDGHMFPNYGCYLDVIPQERLVFTSALGAGFRPVHSEMPFTAILTLTPHNTGTRYVAEAFHKDPDGRKKHAEMGFEMGWSTVLDQLVAYIKASNID